MTAVMVALVRAGPGVDTNGDLMEWEHFMVPAKHCHAALTCRSHFFKTNLLFAPHRLNLPRALARLFRIRPGISETENMCALSLAVMPAGACDPLLPLAYRKQDLRVVACEVIPSTW